LHGPKIQLLRAVFDHRHAHRREFMAFSQNYRLPWNLIRRSGVIPNIDRNDRSFVILVDNDRQISR